MQRPCCSIKYTEMHNREKIQECVGIFSIFCVHLVSRKWPHHQYGAGFTKAILLLENRSFAVVAEEISLTGKYRDAACTDVVDQD